LPAGDVASSLRYARTALSSVFHSEGTSSGGGALVRYVDLSIMVEQWVGDK